MNDHYYNQGVDMLNLFGDLERENLGSLCKKCAKVPATKDYNGHGYWVCDACYDILSDYFDEEYN